MRLIVENRPHSQYGKYGVFILAMLAAIQICWADSANFECTYSSKASKDGVKKDSLQARFILDLGRKKSYVTKSRQNFEIQYYMDVKDTLIAFVEVTGSLGFFRIVSRSRMRKLHSRPSSTTQPATAFTVSRFMKNRKMP